LALGVYSIGTLLAGVILLLCGFIVAGAIGGFGLKMAEDAACTSSAEDEV